MKELATSIAIIVAFASAAFAGDVKKCDLCNMTIDTGHRIHYKLDVAQKSSIHVGSLTCAKQAWQKNKTHKIVFYGMDFVSGEWTDASKGQFLVHSKLKIGTGMDKGGAAILFSDPAMAKKGQKLNGGRLVSLDEALKSVAR